MTTAEYEARIADLERENQRMKAAVGFAVAFLSEKHKTLGSHCGTDYCGACGAEGSLKDALTLGKDERP